MKSDSSSLTSKPKSAQPLEATAYLIVKGTHQDRTVFPLIAGQVATIGRAPTNRIVIPDEICSRNHCEVFQSGSDWILRELGSRNGTLLNGKRIAGDNVLRERNVIQIGVFSLGFTRDISRPFPDLDNPEELDGESDTAVELVYQTPQDEASPLIVQRRRRTRFHAAKDLAGVSTSRELAALYRLAMAMGAAHNERELSEVVLAGLCSSTCADIGAVLCPKSRTVSDAAELDVIAYKSTGRTPYQKVSDSLSRTVLREGEAILAQDISEDQQIASRDSLDELRAQSLICAPIRTESNPHEILGLIHLYCTNPDNALDADELEFTLAVAEQLAQAMNNLREKESLVDGLALAQDKIETLRAQLQTESELVGASPSIALLKDTISRISPTDATALVLGESGVGKELVAREVHFSSHRRNAPFVCMNCAALSESLLESELFGHEKGAFTGATGRKFGKFEQADRGTLFLDEVGEMGLSIQAKFLRVLEGHAFERVGGSTPIDVDVRVVAATNRDLEEAVRVGKFRKDLYFRLNVVQIHIDPLRERKSDIPLLIQHFLHQFAQKSGRHISSITEEAMEILNDYDWPGNVRELQNAVERAVVLCNKQYLGVEDFQLSNLQQGDLDGEILTDSSGYYKERSLQDIERDHIIKTLRWTEWNKSRAAQILGIERSTLDRKLKRYKIPRE